MARPTRSNLRSVGSALMVVLVFATACGDGALEPAASAPSPPTSSMGGTVPATSGFIAPPPESTAPDAAPSPTASPTIPDELPGGAVEQLIAGVTVRARTQLGAIPDQASVIEYGGTLIDDGAGPMLCFAGVADSYPPQCGGPIVDLVMGDWATVEGDVAFGERTLELAWPPSAGRIEVLAERPYEPPEATPYEPPQLPEACRGIREFVPVEVLAEYASQHTDVTATPAVVDGGRIGVLQVIEPAIDQVRSDLATDDAEPCLEPVDYSTDQLRAAQDAIGASWQAQPDLYIGSTGSGNAFNRVTVDLLVADAATVGRLAAPVEDPSILLVFGSAEILDGA